MLPPHGQRGAIRIRSGRIEEVAGDLRAQSGERLLDLDGLAVLPGLVNAHDHLDLDLLPRLGDPPYGNSYQWLDDLVRKRPRAGVDLARVSRIDRIAWGAYRNLFGGVTTVAHHGPLPLPAVLASGRLPVRLRLPFAWSDSLREPDAISRGRRAQGRMPFAIHLADGTDEMAARELDALDRAGLLGRGTVIVHGVALDADGCRRLGESGAALVWCPRTSHFLFGTTAPVAEVPAGTAVALGTDSTMTGSVTLLDELRFAASLGLVDGERLLAMVTAEAARALALPDHGAIRPGAVADLIALPAAPTAAEALLRATPGSLALVMVGGRLRLAAPRFARGLDLEPAVIEGAARFVAPGFGDLVGRIRSALPADFESPALASLAGGVPSR
jgi:cytosine/adenosine deaminase-related metal-dependent hydrolase